MYLNMMANNIRISLLLPFSIFSFLITHLTSASDTDTISLTHPLSANQTIVSDGGAFELGFFAPGNSSHNYYIGIWYKRIPNKTVIWVANREAPVPNPSSAELTISGDGNLVLLNQSKIPAWSSNSTQINPNSAVAVLLDTGNLVLRNGSESSTEIWQSFAHPTDTWMPSGWLGVDKVTGDYQSITSWKSSYDPAPGLFSQSMDHDGSNQYVLLWNGTQIYWTSGLYNGQYFSNVPGTKAQTVFNFTFVDDKQRKYATYTITQSSVVTRFVIGPSGQGKQWLWMDSSQEWSPIFTQPLDQCDVFAVCGAFGICDQNSSSFCSCSIGFQPTSIKEWSVGVWNSGCVRRTQLKCASNSSIGGGEDGFLEMKNMQLPANNLILKAASTAECREACLNNCSCNAYAYYNGCSIWTADLMNLRQLYDGDSGASTLNLRIASIDLPSSKSSHRTVIIASTASVAVVILIILCIVLGLICARIRRKRLRKMAKQEDGSLIMFRYSDLQRMTKNFSDKLGNGGFGSVYRGTIADAIAIAVKKLNGFAQGEKQFRTEVTTLGSVQHVNLVRLLGFCSQGSERLLVYEYMPGGSLNSHLFGEGSSKSKALLDWRTRYEIILGAARGLAYLHEQCRECIIHCDVKPDNILLDHEFRPRVADFGLAKIIGHDFSRVLTTMRGTIGYLAPEWISGLPITTKVDVYSFGMMLFEVVSGKRNADVSGGFFPSWAARQVIEGKMESLLDGRLEGDADMEEVSRVSRVACWCIQDSEDQRPSMGLVVKILEGRLEVNMPPMPMALQHLAVEGDGDSPVFYHTSSHEDQDAADTQGLIQ